MRPARRSLSAPCPDLSGQAAVPTCRHPRPRLGRKRHVPGLKRGLSPFLPTYFASLDLVAVKDTTNTSNTGADLLWGSSGYANTYKQPALSVIGNVIPITFDTKQSVPHAFVTLLDDPWHFFADIIKRQRSVPYKISRMFPKIIIKRQRLLKRS